MEADRSQDPLAAVRSAAQGREEPLPVTVLSGFLGAGKTTLLKHILTSKEHGLKIGIIVNDFADLNVDANLLKDAVQTEERMVSLSNGCICCTLREDLFVELAKLATSNHELDHVIIESSGISEPLPVAETFTFRDGNGTSLADVARLDSLVTVLDGSNFLSELQAVDSLRARSWEANQNDERTVAQLLCDQLEFANIIVMSKTDLLTDEEKKQLPAILKRFNPSAQLIESSFGQVNPHEFLNTRLFDLNMAEEHPQWLQEARIGEHTPETIEYGISSVTFRSRRPFNVERFEELTRIMESTTNLVLDSSSEEKSADPTISVSSTGQMAAKRVIRCKGLVWLATQQSHWQQGTASLAGQKFTVAYGSPWLAAINNGTSSEFSPNSKEEPWGDRRTELVVIGKNMDNEAIVEALEACVATDDEMNQYTETFLSSQPLDIIDETKIEDEALIEKIKQYKIEILAPKSHKTQMLKETPKATEAISAHACIAKYQGKSTEGVASFSIQRYLRYAHLIPDLASGLVKEFELNLDVADQQTALLADETMNALTETISFLNNGDKVELEWLQIRVEYDTHVDEDRFRMVQQCQKLAILTADAEQTLIKQYPKPEIMVKKDQMCTPELGPKQQKAAERKAQGRKGKKGKKNRR